MSAAVQAAFLVLMLWLALIGIFIGAIEENDRRHIDEGTDDET